MDSSLLVLFLSPSVVEVGTQPALISKALLYVFMQLSLVPTLSKLPENSEVL